MKEFIIVVALIYTLSFLVGWYFTNIDVPLAIQVKRSIHEAVLTKQLFISVIDLLKRRELLGAIAVTFFVNFTFGAFLTTTLPGVVPLLGALVICIVTLIRGFSIGVTYPEVLAASPASFLLGMGTLILELSAYVLSAAAGINIATAPIFPKRYAARSRVAAFKAAWIDAGRIFVIVAMLLILGAVWEMTGLFLVTSG
jgi:hypothetical protein